MSSNLTHLVQVTIISCLTDPLLLPCPTTISSQQYSKVICLRCRSKYVISWLKHSSASHLTQRKSQNSCKGLQGFMQSSFSFSLASSAILTLADSHQLQLPSAVLGRFKVYSCLRAFALLVPSAWNDLPNIRVALSLSHAFLQRTLSQWALPWLNCLKCKPQYLTTPLPFPCLFSPEHKLIPCSIYSSFFVFLYPPEWRLHVHWCFVLGCFIFWCISRIQNSAWDIVDALKKSLLKEYWTLRRTFY